MKQPEDKYKEANELRQKMPLSSSASNFESRKIFKSSQHRFVSFFLNLFPWFITGVVAFYCVEMLQGGIPGIEVISSMGASILAVVLLFWLTNKQKNLHYAIDEDFLYFKGSLNGGKIAVQDINAVYVDFLPTGGKRPALNSKGLIVNYGEGYQMFISPEEEEQFIKTLQMYNPRIIFNGNQEL